MIYSLIVDGREVLRREYVKDRWRTLPRRFEERAQRCITQALDETEPTDGCRIVRYVVTEGGEPIIRSWAQRPA